MESSIASFDKIDCLISFFCDFEERRNAVYESLHRDSESSGNRAVSEKVGLPEISKLLRWFHKDQNSLDFRFGNFRHPFFFDSNACL